MRVDEILDPLCDFELRRHLRLWHWIFGYSSWSYQHIRNHHRQNVRSWQHLAYFICYMRLWLMLWGDSYSVCVSVWYSSWCGNSPEAEGNVYSYGVHKQYKLYLLVEFNHMYLFLRTKPFTPMSFIASADCFYRRNFRLTNSLNVLNWIPLVGLYSIRINYKP